MAARSAATNLVPVGRARNTSIATVRLPGKPERLCVTGQPVADLEVVAGALFDQQGRVLIAQRPKGKELAGRWEFPGGKLCEDESPLDGLVRELREELGVFVHSARRLIRYSHDYPARRVSLDMWVVTSWRGEVQSLDGQAVRWVPMESLAVQDILEADQPIIEALMTELSAGRLPV